MSSARARWKKKRRERRRVRIIIDFVVDETGGAVTVSSGEGTASTWGGWGVVIRLSADD